MTNPAVDSRPLPRLSIDDRLVAVLRAPRPDATASVVERLIEPGIGCIELTLTTPDALHELPRLREGVDVSVKRLANAPTGLMLKERRTTNRGSVSGDAFVDPREEVYR